jgi:hypothetical protein
MHILDSDTVARVDWCTRFAVLVFTKLEFAPLLPHLFWCGSIVSSIVTPAASVKKGKSVTFPFSYSQLNEFFISETAYQL